MHICAFSLGGHVARKMNVAEPPALCPLRGWLFGHGAETLMYVARGFISEYPVIFDMPDEALTSISPHTKHLACVGQDHSTPIRRCPMGSLE